MAISKTTKAAEELNQIKHIEIDEVEMLAGWRQTFSSMATFFAKKTKPEKIMFVASDVGRFIYLLLLIFFYLFLSFSFNFLSSFPFRSWHVCGNLVAFFYALA